MLVHVRVFPGSKREKIVQEGDGTYVIYLREEAKRNEANRRIVELMARVLGVPAGSVRIKTGHRAPKKTLEIIHLS